MGKMHVISMSQWRTVILQLAPSFSFYAPVAFNSSQDYELIGSHNTDDIIYNHPKPSTPLKTFFLPVKENVTLDIPGKKQTIIMGAPACDLAALDILDEMYLNRDYTDMYYQSRRDNTIIAGYDCHSVLENCHCTSCGVNPFPEKNMDLILTRLDEWIYIQGFSAKGDALMDKIREYGDSPQAGRNENGFARIEEIRSSVRATLTDKNNKLPDYRSSGPLIGRSGHRIWQSYASTCVSCGACATSCPTCSCFLLIDRPGFEKVRQLDACQYPGFERVAGGEDPLGELPARFKNRYLCKYVWKPLKFKSVACTGCGRCIDTCIGNISKNDLLEELAHEDRIKTPTG